MDDRTPERIWIDWKEANRECVAYDEPPVTPDQACQSEYVRADAITALRAEVERLTPYVAAFRREEERADRLGEERDAAVAAERERCARIAEDRHQLWNAQGHTCLVECDVTACRDIAAAIRAGEGEP